MSCHFFYISGMKIYVVSGLGADFKVLERLQFPEHHEVVFLPWLVPYPKENFKDYVQRMSESIDDSEPFYLLGYSFGGIIVQEIHQVKPSQKVVILGSIRCDQEKSNFIKLGQITKIPQFLPALFFGDASTQLYCKVRKWVDPKNPKVLQYFRMRDPYYLKWSIQRITEWKFAKIPHVIQILGDRDIVFPIKNSKPDYVIKGGTHLFPATKSSEVSKILREIFI